MAQKEYAAIRKMMAEILEQLTGRVVACRDRELGAYKTIERSAAAHGAQPIINCAIAAQEMLKLLREAEEFENQHELLLALEHSAVSTLNLIMLLMAYDTDD